MKTKNILTFLVVIFILSAITAGFGTMPSTWAEFWAPFAVCSLFWSGMLIGVLFNN